MRPSSPGSTPASTANSFGVPLVQAILGAAVVTVAMQYISFCDIYSIEDSYILFVSSSALCPMEEQLALLAAKCPLSWKKNANETNWHFMLFVFLFFSADHATEIYAMLNSSRVVCDVSNHCVVCPVRHCNNWPCAVSTKIWKKASPVSILALSHLTSTIFGQTGHYECDSLEQCVSSSNVNLETACVSSQLFNARSTRVVFVQLQSLSNGRTLNFHFYSSLSFFCCAFIFHFDDSVSCWRTRTLLVCGAGRIAWSALSHTGHRRQGKFGERTKWTQMINCTCKLNKRLAGVRWHGPHAGCSLKFGITAFYMHFWCVTLATG